MRLFYFLLYVTLNYSLRLFYPRLKIVNGPKLFLGRTIYVSNHAASFMDPLVVASLRRPIVFFLTRSDVFTTFTKPFLWAAHMLPIYRQLDGVDTKELNAKVFEKCTKVLSFGRNLLIFGEGFTDDTFIRRLKPVKKGAIRIGFTALESMNWKKKIYVAAVGCNYSDPNTIGSDLLVSTSERFCLNDYKEAYLENPNKTITELTRKVELMMQEQITHVEDKDWVHFHEHVMRITRKGMNAENSDFRIPLVQRWRYSQRLAIWINELTDDQKNKLKDLRSELATYFGLIKRMRLNENDVYSLSKYKQLNRTNELLALVVLFPFALLGLIHCWAGYLIIKRFVEKSFKRRVFWGSVKLLLGMVVFGLINIPFIFLFKSWIYPSTGFAILYYFGIGFYGLAAYKWFNYLKRYKEKGMTSKSDISKLIEKRTLMAKQIQEEIPVT